MIRGEGFVPPIVQPSPTVPCCGVLAVSLFCNISYDDAWLRLRQLKCDRRKTWRGWTYDREREAVISDLDITYRKVQVVPAMTVGSFADWQARNDRHYMLMVAGHVLHLKGGILTDQTMSCLASQHKAKRLKLKCYLERL